MKHENQPHERDRMVDVHLARRGIADPRVLSAFRQVRREDFVAPDQTDAAYSDNPLPIECEQTISQPYIVARTVEALELKGDEKVLEIGAGSGYAAAILGTLAREVYTVERHGRLARSASERLHRLGFRNVKVVHGDGTLGLPDHAPFEAIAVAAAAPKVPKALLEQLAIGGRVVMPVGPADLQTLVRVTRVGADQFETEPLEQVRFVPLVGIDGA